MIIVVGFDSHLAICTFERWKRRVMNLGEQQQRRFYVGRTFYSQEDTPIARFRRYLQFNAAHPNPNYAGPISFLISQANSIGLQSQTLEFTPSKPVLLLTWPGSNRSLPSVLFNSHLDSVPAEPSKWSHPPFSATLTPDGKIFAPGAQDDKCIAMQYLEAIHNLKAKGFTPLRTVHISYVPDEEIGGFDGSAKFVKSKEFEDLNIGFVLDEGQASTSGEFRVFYADRSPWGLRESQFDVVKVGEAMNSEVVSVNFVYLKAGIPSPSGFVMNVQPSEADAGFDLRLPPTVDPDLIKKIIAEE
ncbi:hypothetical protein CRYUN_Cryun35bG0066200 [Craigia yunnanensis]